MHDAVRSAFPAFSARFEGRVNTMYLDVKGLVTIGIGNLIDPIFLAVHLPFVHLDGVPATPYEVSVEWNLIKERKELAEKGWREAAKLCQLHLTPEGIDRLVDFKLESNERLLKERFPDFESWPADAQLGLLSMAWAMGPSFRFPHFEAAAKAQAWAICALECRMDEGRDPATNKPKNPGLVPRNLANRLLFQNATLSTRLAAPVSHLFYPGSPA